MTHGVVFGVAANVIWGVQPVFWKLFHAVPAMELLMHRIVWSFIMLIVHIFATKQRTNFRDAVVHWRTIAIYTLSGALLGVTLFVTVWAILAGYIVETSLGYFMLPLVNVLLGVVFLRERLRLWQWIAMALAFGGVLEVAIVHGAFPWVALTLSFSFGFYGLIKKQAPLGALYGVALELGIFFIPAVIYLLVLEVHNHTATMFHCDWWMNLLLVASGLVMVVPLLLFSTAAKLISMTNLGLLQYISPTMQFGIGVWGYHEPFSTSKLVGFCLVWLGLLIYTAESIVHHRQANAKTEEDQAYSAVKEEA
ncbi:hypothetical protein AeNC1_009511 [Aphanomyces euteiches]|nr:hypothetical protein AeNC1_009511 [Aphanomyces euteiches]